MSKELIQRQYLNDSMTKIVFENMRKKIKKKSRILQIGISFKENIPDIRNSKAAELAILFIEKKFNIEIYDPVVSSNEVMNEYGIELSKPSGKYDYVIIAVPHNFLNKFDEVNKSLLKNKATLFDLTGKYKDRLNKSIYKYWSL